MKKLIIFTTSLILFAIFVLPFVLSLGIKIIPGGDQPGYNINDKRGIFGGMSVSQTFTSQENGLTAVGISLGNPNLKNQKEIKFDLIDSGGQKVRTSSLSGMNVGDGAFVKFVFDSIPDSKGKTYSFTISSPEANREEVIDIFVSTGYADWIGKAVFGNDEIANGMPIVVYFKSGGHLKVAADIYSSWIKRMFGS